MALGELELRAASVSNCSAMATTSTSVTQRERRARSAWRRSVAARGQRSDHDARRRAGRAPRTVSQGRRSSAASPARAPSDDDGAGEHGQRRRSGRSRSAAGGAAAGRCRRRSAARPLTAPSTTRLSKKTRNRVRYWPGRMNTASLTSSWNRSRAGGPGERATRPARSRAPASRRYIAPGDARRRRRPAARVDDGDDRRSAAPGRRASGAADDRLEPVADRAGRPEDQAERRPSRRPARSSGTVISQRRLVRVRRRRSQRCLPKKVMKNRRVM